MGTVYTFLIIAMLLFVFFSLFIVKTFQAAHGYYEFNPLYIAHSFPFVNAVIASVAIICFAISGVMLAYYLRRKVKLWYTKIAILFVLYVVTTASLGCLHALIYYSSEKDSNFVINDEVLRIQTDRNKHFFGHLSAILDKQIDSAKSLTMLINSYPNAVYALEAKGEGWPFRRNPILTYSGVIPGGKVDIQFDISGCSINFSTSLSSIKTLGVIPSKDNNLPDYWVSPYTQICEPLLKSKDVGYHKKIITQAQLTTALDCLVNDRLAQKGKLNERLKSEELKVLTLDLFIYNSILTPLNHGQGYYMLVGVWSFSAILLTAFVGMLLLTYLGPTIVDIFKTQINK